MKSLIVCIVVFLSIQSVVFSQCIDNIKVEAGGDYGFVKYMFLCPSYTFAYNGDTSKKWNVLNAAIDIKQAPKKALLYKKLVEKTIKNYAGLKFFSDLRFIDVEVSYPEKYQVFIDSGRDDVKDVANRVWKAKYFYHYQFGPNDTAIYLIGIAVNKKGKIISPFTFPSKKYYRPIDKNFTYCKLIDIARRTQKNIDPIEKISLEYDKRHKKFYWLVSRQLVNDHEGINYINQVEINAANLLDAKQVISEIIVTY